MPALLRETWNVQLCLGGGQSLRHHYEVITITPLCNSPAGCFNLYGIKLCCSCLVLPASSGAGFWPSRVSQFSCLSWQGSPVQKQEAGEWKYFSLAQLQYLLFLYPDNCWVQFETEGKAKRQEHLQGLIFSGGVIQNHILRGPGKGMQQLRLRYSSPSANLLRGSHPCQQSRHMLSVHRCLHSNHLL